MTENGEVSEQDYALGLWGIVDAEGVYGIYPAARTIQPLSDEYES